MKKSKKIIAAVSVVIMSIAIVPVSVLAKDVADKNFAVYNVSHIQSSSDKTQFSSGTAAAKIDSNQVLDALLLKSNNMESFSLVSDDCASDINYEAKFDDGSVVSFDKDMNVIAYSNLDRNSESGQTSNEDLIQILKQAYHIDETYHLDVTYEANENGNDDTKYYWGKIEKNGFSNLYDGLSVRIDGNSNEIVIFRRFNDVVEASEIIITEAEAKRIALNLKEEFNKVTGCNKEYVKPNYYWTEEGSLGKDTDMVRLVYNVNIDNRFYVYVDVETGDVLGGDMKKCTAE